ncbi:biosynthetic-type acetolactate synthase large subunit [Anaerotignum sp. MB30-C6]|uniref:biosynthetic-type acetolactate synthase large subunit n=1 Tax=Anaerotignum sp. MB30-C6 TaxID=3070814 RepID=UPI0027DC5069|nr:biosynthetic-type acetolactate synthase large subunit [Anaerotignum sp. MB30-C6]WMI81865.1 biosynthetic-type acetolactate synthase large subunit [Anaerotignum sp. MB30-C6]
MEKSGCQILIETLIEQGVTTIFGYPGGQVLHIYDELYKNKHRINHVLTAHEQGATHAADGYSRASGKVGVCLATSGPGATNLITGLATAKADSVPIVAITGNVPMELIGTDSFQEVDTLGLSIPVTKHSFRVDNVDNLAEIVREAFRIAKSGRPGPVLVDIPKNIQLDKTQYSPQGVVEKEPNTKPETALLDQALELIHKSKRPIVYCGGGVINANCSQVITQLVEKTDAYMVCSMMGLTAMDNNHSKYLGMSGMHGRFAAIKAMTECDLVIAAGVRFTDRATGNRQKFASNAKIIHLDIDSAEHGKNIDATLQVVGDLEFALSYITSKLEPRKHKEWENTVDSFKNKTKDILPTVGYLMPWEVISAVNERATPETNIATDVGQHQMWVAQYYNFKNPRTLQTSGGLGTMGYGMGAAIGATMATGNKTILFTGDGSFGMNLNELATAVSENLPLIIVILNNGRLGMIRQWQNLFFDNRFMATVLDRKTDFVKLADAFGATGLRATNKTELNEALDKAFALNSPVVLDCLIPDEESVFPMVPPNGSLENIILK